jgi:PAS domain S-box-containing protein
MEEKRKINKYFRLFFVAWTCLILIMITVFTWHALKEKDVWMYNEAIAIHNIDLSIRHWASGHGGVYVPVDDKTQPNKYLGHVLEKDIVTPNGTHLTLMNPAYILRQLHSDFERDYGVAAHITSLKPLRPENKPDVWETKALIILEKDNLQEFDDYSKIDGKRYYRLMVPLKIERSCLKCHAEQGYIEGDLRGGISVSLPTKKYDVAANNRIAWYSVTLLLLWIIGIIGARHSKRRIIRDILQIVENSDVLSESEAKFRTLFETSPVPQIIFNSKDATILDYNTAFANAYSFGQKELIGKKADNVGFWSFENRNEFVLKILKEGFVNNYEIHFSVAGIKQTGLLSASKVLLGKDNCIIGMLVDITERKRLENEIIHSKERAIESDHLKTEYLANMSHEIRSPMNGIIGFAGLLGDDNITSEKKNQYIEIIQNNSKQLLNLINDIIDIAKIEAGQIQLSTSLENINQLMNELDTRFTFEKRKQKKGKLSLIKNTGLEDEESFFFIDRLRVQQIMSNLINNALKFTEQGCIEFGYTVSGGFIEFYVADSGIGIGDDKQKLIFERFRQANENIAKIHGGTGLGLAICRGLVELMGGRIWVESEPEKGSCFKFTVPSKVSLDNIVVPGESTQIELKEEDLTNQNILIVEDIEYNRLLMNEYLENTGATLIFAADGKETIDKLKQTPKIDIVLLDIQLPDTNGYELIKEIRNYHPDAQVVAQTAYALSGDRKKAIDAGFNYYLAKPIKQDVLLSILLNIVRNSVN